jgi:hypothetical protein
MTTATAEDVSWLRQAPHWGFLIYRCDYRSDDAWKIFIKGWLSRVKSYLNEQYDDADLVRKMLFTVKDDRSALDNATVERVHKLFFEWIRLDKAHAERKTAGYEDISFRDMITASKWTPGRWTPASSGLPARVKTPTRGR